MPVSISLPIEAGIWIIGFPLLDFATLAARIQDAFDSEKDNVVVHSVDICPPALVMPAPSTTQELKVAMSTLLGVRKRNATAGTSTSESTIVVAETKRTKRRDFFRIRKQSQKGGKASGSFTARATLPDKDPETGVPFSQSCSIASGLRWVITLLKSDSTTAPIEKIAAYTAAIARLHEEIANSYAEIAEWNNKIKSVLDEM